MKESQLRQLIREEIQNMTQDTKLGEFGEVITSINELIENETYNIYDSKLNKWFYDYVYTGDSSNFGENTHYFMPRSEEHTSSSHT